MPRGRATWRLVLLFKKKSHSEVGSQFQSPEEKLQVANQVCTGIHINLWSTSADTNKAKLGKNAKPGTPHGAWRNETNIHQWHGKHIASLKEKRPTKILIQREETTRLPNRFLHTRPGERTENRLKRKRLSYLGPNLQLPRFEMLPPHGVCEIVVTYLRSKQPYR